MLIAAVILYLFAVGKAVNDEPLPYRYFGFKDELACAVWTALSAHALAAIIATIMAHAGWGLFAFILLPISVVGSLSGSLVAIPHRRPITSMNLLAENRRLLPFGWRSQELLQLEDFKDK